MVTKEGLIVLSGRFTGGGFKFNPPISGVKSLRLIEFCLDDPSMYTIANTSGPLVLLCSNALAAGLANSYVYYYGNNSRFSTSILGVVSFQAAGWTSSSLSINPTPSNTWHPGGWPSFPMNPNVPINFIDISLYDVYGNFIDFSNVTTFPSPELTLVFKTQS